jgi:PAS domain S-box-containing protein
METKELKLLAIDDHPDNLTTLKAVVQEALPGARVFTALSGPAGLALAQAEDPDVILLDIVMPDMDGFAVCRKLKADERLRQIPVIFLTAGRADRANRLKALEAGAEAFLPKPLDEVELVAQIRAMAKIKAASRRQWLEKEQLAGLVAERTQKLEAEVAERKQAEQRLRESEQKFKTLVENTPDIIARFDRELRHVFVNRAAEALAGLPPDMLLGKTHRELGHMPLEQIEFSEHLIREVFETGQPVEFETSIAGPRGPIHLISRGVPEFDAAGQVKTALFVHRDITPRKQAAEALRESEELLSQFMRYSPIYVYIKSVTPTESRVLQASDNFIDMVGIAGQDMVGKSMAELFPAEFAAKMTADDWDVVAKGEVLRVDETLNGRDFITIKFPIVQGERRLLAGYTLDITDQKRTELALRALNQELEQRVAGRTAELTDANAALRRAARLKDEFLATMSHELRTPLTAIQGLSEALEMGVFGSLTEKQIKALGTIRESGQHLLELITDILDVAKLEAGKVELQIGLVAVEDVCQASLRFVRQMAQQKNLRVSQSFDPKVTAIYADSRRLKQMLVNLLSNAVKFTPAGGEVGLIVSGEAARQEIQFIVWDTGIGIAPESQSRLFQPFTQLDNRLAREYAGTGLGLSLVHRMAELHGGEVTVESTGVAGQGSRFTLTLPWRTKVPGTAPLPPLPPAMEAAIAQAAEETPATPRAHRALANLLLVDDNEASLVAITALLQTSGYAVRIAQSGPEALKQAEALRPDLILLDIQMPGMDGLEVLRRLRANPVLATVPVVAVTALAMPGDREKILAAGANEYLSKPVRLDKLLGLLSRLLPPAA